MGKKLTLEQVLLQFDQVHSPGIYSYPRFIYHGNKIKSIITCNKHGDFQQTPACHKKGQGCPKCANEAQSTGTEKFIKLSKCKFGENTFGYDKCQCSNSRDRVILKCEQHGYFEVGSEYHLSKDSSGGCKKCQYEKATKDRSISKSEFIEQSEKAHGTEIFDFSKVPELLQLDQEVELQCLEYGHCFKQKPSNNIAGSGCHLCAKKKSGKSQTKTTEKFITESKIKFPGKLGYEKTIYTKSCEKLILTCLNHGDFYITPNKHLTSLYGGCKKCAYEITGDKLRRTQDQFIEILVGIYGKSLNYDKVEYVDNTTKVALTCKKEGHLFHARPVDLFKGCGCNLCNKSRGEGFIVNYLQFHEIPFIPQKRFKTCKHKGTLPFDFYLPELNLLIEFQGQQHRFPVEYFGGQKAFNELKIRDNIKKEWAQKNNIELLEIWYDQDIEKTLSEHFKAY